MFRNVPNWLASGLLILPVVAVLGILLWAITLGAFSPLFWLILPAILFETLVETSFRAMSDSRALNFLFAVLFWFVVGAGTGWLSALLRRSAG